MQRALHYSSFSLSHSLIVSRTFLHLGMGRNVKEPACDLRLATCDSRLDLTGTHLALMGCLTDNNIAGRRVNK